MRIAVAVCTGNTTIMHDVDMAESSPNQSDSEIFVGGMKVLSRRVQGMLQWANEELE